MTFYDVGKRIMDIFGAIVGIVLFSPLLIGTAIWIKLVSPAGPVFADIPLRVGRSGKLFRFLKFRSMIPHAHEWLQSQPELLKKWTENNFKLDPDPRLIKGATFLRKSSIDEMPQFFNVLVGDMSIVGPRAYHDFEINAQLQKCPHLRNEMDLVLTIKPGITGLWQVSGRSQLKFEERVELDALYARKKSLLYDLMIILKTPYVVLTGKGAY
jgi:lipopolysaccharide/colanic/teichoic acid biosynthesis glycosyltransferase